MNAQELFNQVVTAIVKQGRSSHGISGCLYRSPSGLRCAVGHVLRDDEYTPDMEGKEAPNILPERLVQFSDLLLGLQGAHDDNYDEPDFVDRFIRDCRKVAEAHSLTMPVLK